ncbi:uncharacterized protein LOC143194805 [Rhynchophorus ferrugineus]|uniref:uncharacterized protein LOC143194805 n=1 Tax=Rhynchophorus ferrugineus TaxID=354439 RepID=UPI003FCE8D94
MSFRLVLLSCFAVVGFAQYHNQPSQPLPAQYPAGVDPKSCPNYPDCSNPLVAVQTADKAQQYNAEPQYQTQQFPAQPQYQQPQYQQPQYQQPQQYQSQYTQPQQYQQPAPVAPAQSQYSPDVQQRLDRGEYIGDGDYHGEGLQEALAPEFAPQEYSAAPVSQTTSPQYYQPQPTAPAYSPAPQAPQQYSFQYNPTAQSPQAPLFNPVSASQYQEPAQLQDSRAYSPVSNVLNSSPSAPAQIPAGVDPNACPNYPFCHS